MGVDAEIEDDKDDKYSDEEDVTEFELNELLKESGQLCFNLI